MKVIFAIARRELDEYFATPLGWVCLFCFLALSGLFFSDSVEMLPDLYAIYQANPYANPFAGNLDIYNKLFIPNHFQLWITLLIFICPAISMRLFSADYRDGSFELLLSSPISSIQIVMGKYLGSIGFLLILIAGTLPQILLLFWMGTPDPGVIGGGIAAIFLVGSAYLAVGMLMSAFTQEQLLAGILAFCLLIAMLLVQQWNPLNGSEIVTDLQPGEKLMVWSKVILSGAAIQGHSGDLVRGILRLQDLVYFTSFIGLMVAIASWRVESRRWN